MQSSDGHRSPNDESDPRKKEPPASTGYRKSGYGNIGAGVWIVLAGWAAGLGVGLFSFWTDSKPVVEQESWSWSLPDLSAEIEPAYRALFEEAHASVAQVLAAHPDSPRAISALGVLCYLAHDREREEATWLHCLERDPDNALAYSRLFSLAEEGANYQRIVELATEAAGQDPGNVTYPGRLGSALLYLKRNEEARAVLERLVQSGKGDADAYFVLGEVCNQLDELRKAERYFAAAVALAPYNASMVFSLAKVCTRLGETELAAQYQRQFQELKATEAAAEKESTGVRQQFRDELHIPSRVSEILRYVGEAYLDAGERPLAEQSWLRAAELSANDSASRQLLANLYDKRGELQQALRWVRDLRRIAPSDDVHYRNEGILLTRLQRFDEAERVFRDLCRMEPTRSSGHAALAEFLAQRGGDLAEAKSHAVRAVELEPSGSHFFLLAKVAFKAGDLATARAAIQQALSQDPGNREYRSFYASIARSE